MQAGSPDHPTVVLVMGLGTQMLAWPEEFCLQLVDAGFHTYNGAEAWERHFRETGAHNTARIDGRDRSSSEGVPNEQGC